MVQQRKRMGFAIGAMRRLGRLPLPLLQRLGALIGTLLWWSNSRERQVTEINLARCLPALDDAERRVLARARLDEFGRNALAMLHVWFAEPERVLAAIAEVEGEALLLAALAEGRGAVLLAPHLGNWELTGMYLGRRYGITSMYLPNRKNPALDQLVRAVRSRDGATLAPADGSGVRTLLKALKAGRLVGILPDQEPKQAGAEFAPFFGTPALTMTLTSNLVERTGARVVMAYALRRADGNYRLVFRAPDADIYSADLAVSLAGLNHSVEQCARDGLAQYQWEYKRFKHQPPGVPEPY